MPSAKLVVSGQHALGPAQPGHPLKIPEVPTPYDTLGAQLDPARTVTARLFTTITRTEPVPASATATAPADSLEKAMARGAEKSAFEPTPFVAPASVPVALPPPASVVTAPSCAGCSCAAGLLSSAAATSSRSICGGEKQPSQAQREREREGVALAVKSSQAQRERVLRWRSERPGQSEPRKSRRVQSSRFSATGGKNSGLA